MKKNAQITVYLAALVAVFHPANPRPLAWILAGTLALVALAVTGAAPRAPWFPFFLGLLAPCCAFAISAAWSAGTFESAVIAILGAFIALAMIGRANRRTRNPLLDALKKN